MSVLKKRSAGAWHDPIAYAGLICGRPPQAAANDNRDSRAAGRRQRLKDAAPIAALGFGLAGTLGIAGRALGWW